MTTDDDIKAFLRGKVKEFKSKADTSTKIGTIRKFYPEIKELLAAGASHREVVELLKEKNFEFTLGTFAGYLTEVRQEDPEYTPPKRQSRMPARSASPQSDGAEVNATPSPAGAAILTGQPETPRSKPSLTRDLRRRL